MQKDYNYHKLVGKSVPKRLQVIDNPPKQLFYRGAPPDTLLNKPVVAIVGSRKPTPYGREVTSQIARELAKLGIVIVSGLALGIDSIAHRACIEAGGQTIAVLPCGPEMIYPSAHRGLAKQIIDHGGALLTEYPEGTPGLKQNFIARNRLVSGLSDIVIVTEAAEKSGTLHTANFALAQNKTVMAVPGPITSPYSKGTNNLIRAGALPLTQVSDVAFALGITSAKKRPIVTGSLDEQTIISLMQTGITNGSELQLQSQLSPQQFNQTLTLLEINGFIAPLGSNHWQIIG